MTGKAKVLFATLADIRTTTTQIPMKMTETGSIKPPENTLHKKRSISDAPESRIQQQWPYGGDHRAPSTRHGTLQQSRNHGIH